MAIMTGKVTYGRLLALIFVLQLIYPPISADLEIIPEPDGVPLYGFNGEDASLWCRTSGVDPPPPVTWLRGNGSIISTGEELKFEPLKLEDVGEYTCRAGSLFRIFDVKVYDTEILGSFSGEQTKIQNHHERDGNILTWYHSWVVLQGEEKNKVATWRVTNGQVTILENGYTVDRTTGDLLMYDVTLAKEGKYTSKMFAFSSGVNFKYFFLHVYIAPSRIVMGGLDAPVVENKEIIITCSALSVKPSNVTFEWSLTNSEGTVPDGTQTYTKNTDGTFSVTGTLKWIFKRREENGFLKCIAKHGVDPARTASQQKKIIVIYPFRVKTVEESSSELPVRGRNKRLRCQTVMEGKPRNGRYSWYKDGQGPLRERKYSGTGTNLLTITSLEDGDIGKYECRIVNDAGHNSSDVPYNLEKVLYAPIISMDCPRPINESHSAVINCDIDAEPAVEDAEIKWLFKGVVLSGKMGRRFSLTDTSRNDRGVYTCQAENKVGPAAGNCTIVVNYGPTGIPDIKPKNIMVKVDEEFTLRCGIYGLDNGYPEAKTFVWKKGDKVIQDQPVNTYSLIPELVSNGGEYSCALKNAYGESKFGKTLVSIEAPITIEGESGLRTLAPLYSDEDFVISYNVSGTLEKTFTLKNSSHDVTSTHFTMNERTIQGIFSYGQTNATHVDWKWQLQPSYFNNCNSITFFNGDYSFMAEGTEAGQSSLKTSVFRIFVQYPPVWGSSSKVQSSALEMTKTLLCDVCAEPPVHLYEWTFKGRTIGNNNPKLEISVKTGEDFGFYTCRAQNKIGWNIFNITLEEKGSPHTPEDFRVISRTSRTLLVKWTVTFNGGFDLEKFELSGNDSKNAFTHTVTECLNSSECQYRIRDLLPKKMYWLQVRAKNKWGNYARSYSSYDETTGRTQAKPNFVPLNPEVRDDYMMVKWLYDPRDQRKRRSTDVNDDVVGLVVKYKKEEEPEFRQYPLNGKIPVVDQSAKIEGSFDPTTNYHVVYTLYEGEELAFTLDPEVISAHSTEEAANAGVVAGAIVGVILVILLVVVIAVILLRRRKQRRPRLDMDKNSHSQPPLALESNIGGSEDGRLEHNPRPPMPGGKPTLVHGPENRNGMKPENPYENVTPPYANVKKRPRISSSQTSLYDNAQYEDFEFSKNGTQAHGDSVAPIPAKRKSKAKPKTPEEEDPQGLLYADLTFDEHGQRKQQVTPEQIHGIDGRVDYASLDFDQMKANARAGPHPLMPAEEESPYHNVDPRGKPV